MQNLLSEIKKCSICEPHLDLGANPVVTGHKNSKIVIIGQAPGTKVHKSGIPWDDASGKQLRKWLNVSDEDFYVRIGTWEHNMLYLHVDAYDNKKLDKLTIKNTNRYIQLKRKQKLPIVFDYDKQLSLGYKFKDGRYLMTTNHGGKWLFIDNNGFMLKEPKH